MLDPKSQFFLMDRGVLTNYLYGLNKGIPDQILSGLTNEFLDMVAPFNYITMFLDCSLDIANSRTLCKDVINIDSKIKRNISFEPYFDNLNQFDLLSPNSEYLIQL